jgi:hypothetical protein
MHAVFAHIFNKFRYETTTDNLAISEKRDAYMNIEHSNL